MGGRVSDKYLTENSGLLRRLLPGDIVLADRGFDIADSVGFYQARLHMPAFTRGKKQLSAKEVEESRKIGFTVKASKEPCLQRRISRSL